MQLRKAWSISLNKNDRVLNASLCPWMVIFRGEDAKIVTLARTTGSRASLLRQEQRVPWWHLLRKLSGSMITLRSLTKRYLKD